MATSPPDIGFLDTDIQLFRLNPNETLAKAAEDLVAGLRLRGVSTYSRLEFKRNHLRDMAYLHRNLSKTRSTAKTLELLTRLAPMQQRKLNRVLVNLSRSLLRVEKLGRALQESERIDLMLLELENLMQLDWDWFFDGIDFVKNGTGCVRAQEAPEITNGKMDVSIGQCRTDKIRCQIHNFFQSHQQRFLDVRDEIAKLPAEPLTPELSKFGTVITEAQVDSKSLCDDRVCARLGDVLIAVDGADGVPMPTLISSNAKEYRVITNAIPMPYFQFVKPPSDAL